MIWFFTKMMVLCKKNTLTGIFQHHLKKVKKRDTGQGEVRQE
jgi:hypothetical protein